MTQRTIHHLTALWARIALLALLAGVVGCAGSSRPDVVFRSEGDDELGRVRAVLDSASPDRARLVVYSYDRGQRVHCETAGWNDLPIPVVGRAAEVSPGLHRLQVTRAGEVLERKLVLEPGRLYVAVTALADDQLRVYTTDTGADFSVFTEFASVMSEPPAVDFGDPTAEPRAPQVLKMATPRYPQHLRDWAVEGAVVANVLVTREGRAGQICLRSSDHPLLDELVVDAVRRSRFVPGTVGGVPVDTWVTLPFEFNLD